MDSAHTKRDGLATHSDLAASTTPHQPATSPPPGSDARGKGAPASARGENWHRWLLWTLVS